MEQQQETATATTLELSDEELRKILQDARARSGQQQTSETKSGNPVPPPVRHLLTPTGKCIKCKTIVEQSRFLCNECDEKVTQARAAREKWERDEATKLRLKDSGLPKIFRDSVISWQTVRTNLNEYASSVDVFNAGKGLFLYGNAGTRKTSFAAAYLAEQIRAGAEGRYVYVPDLFTELAEIYSADDARSRADVIERYAEAHWLVLDDLDKAKPSRHAAEVLLAILDFRYREGLRRMIVTANVSIDEMARPFEEACGENFAGPMVRRLAELCTSVPMVAA